MAIHKPTFLINHEKFTQLYVTLMVFVLAEIYGFGDNFEEKYLFAFRFSLVSLHFLSLMYILITTLSHYSDPRRPGNDGGIVLIVVSMIIASATCILFVILISTIATIIICISWIVTISIVVVLRWNDIVHQMRIIIADVANKSFR
ncbi:cyclin-like F-box [Trifolium medium]|uniref:Cyclin-like F-box n=1 Tax=Trifolium medium TaxID=97028 RepID=A0A392MQY6_9FABA|nr:cyclin-like F-box [Trifolium medium]